MPRNGFTLLELTLAMTVACMLAVTLYASLRVGIKSRDHAEAAVEPARQAQVAMELIGRDLESALPPPSSTSSSFTVVGPFVGQDGGSDVAGDTMEFFAVGGGGDDVDPTRDDGIKKIDLGVQNMDDGTPALVRKVTHNLLAQQVPEPDTEVLCRNVTGFNLRYLVTDTWNDAWDSTAQGDSLPTAVEVTMDVRQADGSTYRALRIFTLPCATTNNQSSAATGGG